MHDGYEMQAREEGLLLRRVQFEESVVSYSNRVLMNFFEASSVQDCCLKTEEESLLQNLIATLTSLTAIKCDLKT